MSTSMKRRYCVTKSKFEPRLGRQVPPFAASLRAPQSSALRFQIARLYPDQPPALLLDLISGSIVGFHFGASCAVIPLVRWMPKIPPLDTKTLTICFFKLISRILFQFLAVSLGADASSDNNPQSVVCLSMLVLLFKCFIMSSRP